MRKLVVLAIVAALVPTAPAALAQERAVRASHAALTAGHLDQAERTLVAETRVHASKPEVMLNLAAVYARSGRAAQAAELYRQVLAQDDAMMDLAGGRTLGAHRIAQAGLARLAVTVASR